MSPSDHPFVRTPRKTPAIREQHVLHVAGRDPIFKPLARFPKTPKSSLWWRAGRLAGVKYYVKLTGTRSTPSWRLRREDLQLLQRKDTVLGFPVDAEGHLFDPSRASATAVSSAAAVELRRPRYSTDMGFNTTATAADLWPKAGILRPCLHRPDGLDGLGRLLLRRRDA